MAKNPVRNYKLELFEETVLRYLDAAYNLARWLTRNDQDAEDVVQEAYLRALSSFDSFQIGRDGRAWLLKIVRNTCYTWMRQNRRHEVATHFDDNARETVAATWPDPESALLQKASAQLLRETIEAIPFEYREVLVMRELEELSYKEIAQILEIPLGTVMSRLSRGRSELAERLCETGGERKR